MAASATRRGAGAAATASACRSSVHRSLGVGSACSRVAGPGRADARRAAAAAGTRRSRRAGCPAAARAARKSLTCAASRNFSPPYLTNGTPRAVSSTSSRSLWCAARISTAWSRSRAPSSHGVAAPRRRPAGPRPARRGSAPAAAGRPVPRGRSAACSRCSSAVRSGRTDVGQVEQRLPGAEVALQPDDRDAGQVVRPGRAGGRCRRRGSRRWPGRRRRPRSARRRPGAARATMSTWIWLTSWYSSTSTWSQRPAIAGPSAGSASSARQASSRSSKSSSAAVALAGDVGAEQVEDRVGVRVAPRELGGDHVAGRAAGVDRPGVDVDQGRRRAGTARSAAGQAVVVAQQVHQVGGVARVEHRHAGGRPSVSACVGDQPVRDGVEGAAPAAVRAASRSRAQIAAARASMSSAARRVKVSSRIRSGSTPRSSSARHPRGQRAGLAGAGAGQDDQRAVAVRGRGQLRVVEPGVPLHCRT